MKILPSLLVLLASTAAALPAQAQFQVEWTATDGVTPDQACPPWTAVDTSSLPVVLGPTSLTIQTASDGQNQGFVQTDGELDFPALLTVEAAIWYVSGSTQSAVREPIAIYVTVPGGVANILWIGQDNMFLNGGTQCATKGGSVNLPTTDGFHVYRLEVNTVTGDITVLYDGAPSGLTGTLIPMGAACSPSPRIGWGELSSVTSGESEWAYFEHNAGAVPSPDSYCTAGTSASGCAATIGASGTPSATASSGFSLTATGVEGGKDGLFFFGTNGRQANAWGTGSSFQCVVPPVKRAGLLSGTGTPGACDGVLGQDLNARWQSKPAQNPGPGAVVQAQLWYRDPLNTSNQTTSLSDAIEFCVAP